MDRNARKLHRTDKAKIYWLQAIVDKLPKTADGISVTPWMRVWGYDADEEPCEITIGDSLPMCDEGNPQGEPFDPNDWFLGKVSACWSTLEALRDAEAAKGTQ